MILVLATPLLACGTGVKSSPGNGGNGSGDPGEPAPDGGGGPTPGRFLPSVDFPLPLTDPTADADGTSNGASLALAPATDGSDLLPLAAVRLDGQIQRANNLMATLDQSGVKSTGLFVKQGDDKSLAAAVTQLSADAAPYAFGALVCRLGKPLTYIKWSLDGTAIDVERFFAAGTGPASSDLITRVAYVKTSDGATIDFAADGQAAGTPWAAAAAEEGTGALVTEALHAVHGLSGAFTLRSVQAWRDGPPPASGYAPTGYLTGQLTAAATGEFVAWRAVLKTVCPDPFDESAPTAPGWCVGRDLAAAAPLAAADMPAAWAKLAPIGIEPKAALGALTQDPSLVCPASGA